MTRRLTASFLIVTLAVLLVLEIPLAMFFGDRERDRFASAVAGDASVLASLYEDALEFGGTLDPVHADNYGQSTGARVIVMDARGISLVDTGNDISRDYSTRPEVTSALAGQRVTGTRYSNTLATELLYVAMPVASGGTVHGALRITLPTTDVDARVHRFWWGLAAMGAMIMVVMAGLSWVLARSVTRPILRLQRAAGEFAAGQLGRRIELEGAPPEVEELGEALNAMAARLEHMIGTQRAFVADASHQLRTPLTALRLRIENMEHLLGEEHEGQLEPVLEEIERLSALVEQLLELSRAEREAVSEEVDLVGLVTYRVDTWSAVAEERQVSLRLVAPETKLRVRASGSAVDQILDNLLDNAVSLTSAGATVTVAVDSGSGHHRLVVSDEGPGLSDEDKQRATDRFWRGDQTRSGSGLGLSIVRSLVEAHGGDMELLDASGGGLQIVVRFVAVD